MAADEWRQCVEWLVQCQILPSDHKATKKDATAFDLAQALRDGVLICHLLNQVKPGSVDPKDFSPRPQMSQFLCLKNIRTFLQTCTREFGIHERDLFQPHDLFDVKDFRKVLDTLSKLSKTDIAQKKYKGGFPPDTKGKPYQDDVEDIYGNLQELAIENDLEDQLEIYDTVYQEDEDKIYDDICYRLDTSLSRKSSQQTTQPPFIKLVTKRDHCLKELIDTEKNYVEALRMIRKYFITPLRNHLNAQQMDTIFAQIQELLTIHSEFYDELLQAVAKGFSKLADVFINYKKKLLIYGDFCSNLPRAQSLIDELCQNDVFRQKIMECERLANECKFRLRDLLHVPMQRVLKYHLLLRELIKNTEKGDEDRPILEVALEAMQDLSLYVNEVKRDHEAQQLIEEIQQSINDLKMPTNTSLKDYGRFQKDGELKVTSHLDGRVRNRYDTRNAGDKKHIFLFDKVMLMCKARMVDKILWGETYSFKEAIVLAEYRIDPELSGASDKKGDKSLQRGWNYQFVIAKQDKRMAFTFYAKTEDQRQKWIEAIMLALDNTQPAAAQGRVCLMQTFDKPTECDICRKLLRGIFFQGYRYNNMAVHKECIGKTPTSVRASKSGRPNSGQPAVSRAKVLLAYKGVPTPPASFRPPLILKEGEMIDVVSQTNEDWWEGRARGEEGFFPSKCVNITRIQRKPSYVPARDSLFNGTSQSKRNGVSEAVPSDPPTPHVISNGPNYVNDPSSLLSYPWYVGEMERPEAQKQLDACPDGTFLIRVTNNPSRKGELSLSIKYANAVRHIKVNRNAQGQFFLAEGRFFDSVQLLVEHYEKNELSDSFPDVATTLKIPYKSVSPGVRILNYAVAVYDYAATSTSQVSLQREDRIAILSKNGQDKGWWKGENLRSRKIGYFPLAYVDELDDS